MPVLALITSWRERPAQDDTVCMKHRDLAQTLKPLVFCVMPYGSRTNPENGARFDFDEIYATVIAPAAEAAGCQALRSDHEAGGGVSTYLDVRTPASC